MKNRINFILFFLGNHIEYIDEEIARAMIKELSYFFDESIQILLHLQINCFILYISRSYMNIVLKIMIEYFPQ